MIKNMICIEESKQDMKITVYFEIRNAELYGGINSIGYSEAGYTIKDNINKIDLSEKSITKFLDKEIENDLIAENQRLKERNQYLEAELECIKKLSALVIAEEQEKSKKH